MLCLFVLSILLPPQLASKWPAWRHGDGGGREAYMRTCRRGLFDFLFSTAGK